MNGGGIIGGILLFAIVSVLAFFGFVVYFIFKQLEFVLRAINLYKKMIVREDTIIKLLIDIRDNTKHATIDEIARIEGDLSNQSKVPGYCPMCKKSDAYLDANEDLFCPNCRRVVGK